MNIRLPTTFAVLLIVAASLVSAAEDVQWVRVTVLLEPGSGGTVRAKETLVPGGIYSLDEVEKRGQEAIDNEILDRVRFLGEQMRDVEQNMRLATLLARQYYLPLEVGRRIALPIIDLNPRLGIVFTPQRFVGDQAVCKVQFLEPEGPSGSSDFTGEPITLSLKDADLQKVLEVFSKIAPVEIIVEPSVTGSVTVDLRDVPCDQALDLILRINGLGWAREGDTLRVAPSSEMSRRKLVRTDATINLPRETWGSAAIASRGDADNPTVVLIVESVDGPPGLAAERDGLVAPRRVMMVSPPDEIAEGGIDELAVFRGRVTETGELRDAEVLATPSQAFSERLKTALETWQLRTVLDEEGRKQEAVVGYGVRLAPQRVLASIGSIEHIGVEVTGGPVPGRPDQYFARAIVTDLDTDEIISAPKVSMRRGEEASVKTGLIAPSGEPSTIEMKFLIDEGGEGIKYSWTLTSNGKVLSSHKAEFGL